MYKVWQEKNGCTFGKVIVVKFSPWEGKEESDSWSDVSTLFCKHVYTLVCAAIPVGRGGGGRGGK